MSIMGSCQSRDAVYAVTAVQANQLLEDTKDIKDIQRFNKTPGMLLQYFDNNIWSIGVVSVVMYDRIMIKDIFTKKITEFYHDSCAINSHFIDSNYRRREYDGSVMGNLVFTGGWYFRNAHYVDNKGCLPDKIYRNKFMYNIRNISPVNAKTICNTANIGKRVKVMILDGNKHSYIYGYISGIGVDHVKIVTQIDTRKYYGQTVLNLAVSEQDYDKIYEIPDTMPDKIPDDMDIRIGSSVFYNHECYIVSDIRGRTVKLCGRCNYIDKCEVVPNNFGGSFERLTKIPTSIVYVGENVWIPRKCITV